MKDLTSLTYFKNQQFFYSTVSSTSLHFHINMTLFCALDMIYTLNLTLIHSL